MLGSGHHGNEVLIVWVAAITLRNFTRNLETFVAKIEEREREWELKRAEDERVREREREREQEERKKMMASFHRGSLSMSPRGGGSSERKVEVTRVDNDYDFDEQLKTRFSTEKEGFSSSWGSRGSAKATSGDKAVPRDWRGSFTKTIMRTAVAVIDVLIARAETNEAEGRGGKVSEFEGQLMRICLDTVDNVKHR